MQLYGSPAQTQQFRLMCGVALKLNFCLSADLAGTSTAGCGKWRLVFQACLVPLLSVIHSTFILWIWSLFPNASWLISSFFCHLSLSLRPLTSLLTFMFLSRCSVCCQHFLSFTLCSSPRPNLLLFPLAQDQNLFKLVLQSTSLQPLFLQLPYYHWSNMNTQEKENYFFT